MKDVGFDGITVDIYKEKEMEFNQFEENTSIYILSIPSWTDWIQPYLMDNKFICWEKGSPVPSQLRASINNEVILLSHHDTLHRDALFSNNHSNVLAQPEKIAELAHDKEKMSSYANKIQGLRGIPTYGINEALDCLPNLNYEKLIVKSRKGTEGLDMLVVEASDLFNKTKKLPNEGFIVQPAILGTEYSVNLVVYNEFFKVYEPVCKGMNYDLSKHPAKRERFFPAEASKKLRNNLMDLAVEYSILVGAKGLVEIEFLVSGNDIYLLEINPRLSATLRMSISASEENILISLKDIAKGSFNEKKHISSKFLSMETPLPKNISRTALNKLFKIKNIQISSRITMNASCLDTLNEVMGQADYILKQDGLELYV